MFAEPYIKVSYCFHPKQSCKCITSIVKETKNDKGEKKSGASVPLTLHQTRKDETTLQQNKYSSLISQNTHATEKLASAAYKLKSFMH